MTNETQFTRVGGLIIDFMRKIEVRSLISEEKVSSFTNAKLYLFKFDHLRESDLLKSNCLVYIPCFLLLGLMRYLKAAETYSGLKLQSKLLPVFKKMRANLQILLAQSSMRLKSRSIAELSDLLIQKDS